jgi:hypothetical protein
MRCVGGQNQICTPTGVWQNNGTSTIELLRNQNFDNTTSTFPWQEASLAMYPIIVSLPANWPVLPQSGPFIAALGGYDGAEDWIFQTVTFPSGATAITLSFYSFVLTDETYPDAVDLLAPYVWEQAVDPEPLYITVLSNLDVSPTWTRRTFQLPPSVLAGRTMEFGFVDGNDAYPGSATLFHVDTVSLTASACPAAGGAGGL